jgi:hypothetical protein
MLLGNYKQACSDYDDDENRAHDYYNMHIHLFFGCLELFVSGIFTCDGVFHLSFLIGCLAVMLASVLCLS